MSILLFFSPYKLEHDISKLNARHATTLAKSILVTQDQIGKFRHFSFTITKGLCLDVWITVSKKQKQKRKQQVLLGKSQARAGCAKLQVMLRCLLAQGKTRRDVDLE